MDVFLYLACVLPKVADIHSCHHREKRVKRNIISHDLESPFAFVLLHHYHLLLFFHRESPPPKRMCTVTGLAD